ncbi:MAG: NADPH-dependent glutamate synthase, partial [Arcobacteraceae bacterium]|nr:NADPH-dependent glutamate synthase [Arcobacteraceae bacterium]
MKQIKDLTKKERRSIPRQQMTERHPKQRATYFDEVSLGYSLVEAQYEAARCIQCKDPACIKACPVGIDIPGFLEQIVENRLNDSIDIVWDATALPAICGRVCPQEIQCEEVCVVRNDKKGKPAVGIGNLEMYIADWARNNGIKNKVEIPPSTGKKVAVIGSGPAGITVAGELAKKGHKVTIFEALHQAGGVLLYGIPEFRLSKDIVAHELKQLDDLGVEIKLNSVVGRTYDIDELLEEYGYDAAFIGVGAGTPNFLNIPGEDLNGVFSANEYLTRASLMKASQFPYYDTPIIPGKNVVILGAGNVAMDSARTALRLGAQSVKIVYRRTKEQSPALAKEIHHAQEEGVEFEFLTSPLEFIGAADGKLAGLSCQVMELGEPDEDGKQISIPV